MTTPDNSFQYTNDTYSEELFDSNPFVLGQSTPLCEVDDLGNIDNYNLFFSGLNVQLTSTGEKTFFHHDVLGSTRKTTDETGKETLSGTYDSYGKIESASGKQMDNLMFTGKEIDFESDLTYFGARYYSGITVRWLSKDKVISFSNPQDFNLYTYCFNNPLTIIDSDGNAELYYLKEDGFWHYIPTTQSALVVNSLIALSLRGEIGSYSSMLIKEYKTVTHYGELHKFIDDVTFGADILDKFHKPIDKATYIGKPVKTVGILAKLYDALVIGYSISRFGEEFTDVQRALAQKGDLLKAYNASWAEMKADMAFPIMKEMLDQGIVELHKGKTWEDDFLDIIDEDVFYTEFEEPLLMMGD